MFRRAAQSLRRLTIRSVVVVGVVEWTTHLPSQGKSSEFYHYITDDWVTPLMRRFLNPEDAHHLAIDMLQKGLAPTFRPSVVEQRLDVTSKIWNRKIPNCIGLAAGFDKDGVAISELFGMGFGLIEIGSVCLEAQPGNPSPRMFRLVSDEGIINRYGLNSMGAAVVEKNLKRFRESATAESDSFDLAALFRKKSEGLLGVNLGKNKNTETPVDDYKTLIRLLGPYADYLVVNVSCPNIDMKDLGKTSSSLEQLLRSCQEERDKLAKPKPLLVKLSPDLTDPELEDICQVLLHLKIDGIILTNTTAKRPSSLISKNQVEKGGLSGRPIQKRSTECIRNVYKWTRGSIPIIGVGGIFSGKDVYDKLRAGASLVQVYSGMVYRGPGTVSKIRNELAQLMAENGQRSLQEVIGLDHEDLFWELREERRGHTEPAFVIDAL